MATKPIAAAAHRTMYGDAVRAAVDSGDIKTMTAARDEALSYLANADAVEKLLPALEAAIQSKGGGIRPLYAVTIQDVLRRGDAGEISRLRAEVASYQRLVGPGAGAHGSIVPYGLAIQEAKARGDDAEVKRLTAHAEALLAQLKG